MTSSINFPMRRTVGKVLRSLGVLAPAPTIPEDLDELSSSIAQRVVAYTMTGPARIAALVAGIRYISAARLPGAIVECGVFRGGSMMTAAYALLDGKVTDRELYLFDTFEGMSAPTEHDVDRAGVHAGAKYQSTLRDGVSGWCYASLEDVRANMAITGYPEERLHYVKGKVEDTLPSQAPDQIALLRLDTDWYESTRDEMEHLYPRLVRGGVLLLDDYGKWQGSRRAVDEYLAAHGIVLLLNRIDENGRIAIKP